jgi:hypothetical protein
MGLFRVKYFLLIIFAASIILSGMAAFAAPPENFTATMVSQGMEMPMARMGSKSRVENPGMQGVVTISLGDAKKTIMMNTTTKVYSEQIIQEKEQMPTMYDSDIVFDKKKVGNETIDGHPCIKYDSVYYRKSKPEEKHKAIIWEAQDLKDFPIQMEVTVPANPKYPGSGGKMVMRYKHVRSANRLQEGQQPTRGDGFRRHGKHGRDDEKDAKGTTPAAAVTSKAENWRTA